MNVQISLSSPLRPNAQNLPPQKTSQGIDYIYAYFSVFLKGALLYSFSTLSKLKRDKEMSEE